MRERDLGDGTGRMALSEPYGGECVGCDVYMAVDDLGLCEERGAKLERDIKRDGAERGIVEVTGAQAFVS